MLHAFPLKTHVVSDGQVKCVRMVDDSQNTSMQALGAAQSHRSNLKSVLDAYWHKRCAVCTEEENNQTSVMIGDYRPKVNAFTMAYVSAHRRGNR